MYGSSDAGEQIADLESWGAPQDMIDAVRAKDFPVYAENWEPLNFFMRLQTQWTVSGMGQKTGLNYDGVKAAAAMLRIHMTSDLFEKIQTMELAALKEMNKNG